MMDLPGLSVVLMQAESVLVWGLVATVLLTVILYGSQGMGYSRLSLPFLIGTCLTPRRGRAVAYGLVIYLLGGWTFAFLYGWVFALVGVATWWLGALVGLLHALFLLVAMLPVVPYLHPRMASPYTGPTTRRRLEPPGFMGLNYGRRTPLTTTLAHVLYGIILGAAFSVPA
jgi:hypothetical protein